jgi:hypothetical protein
MAREVPMGLRQRPIDQRQGRVAASVLLIVLGVLLLALQLKIGLGSTTFFFLVGVAFLATYLIQGSYGFLIPGSLLLGLGLDNLDGAATLPVSDFSPAGLGIGFVLIFVIDLLYRRRTHWWPLIPGAVLILTGLSSGGVGIGRAVAVGGPIFLIVVGIAVLVGWFGGGDGEGEPRADTPADGGDEGKTA